MPRKMAALEAGHCAGALQAAGACAVVRLTVSAHVKVSLLLLIIHRLLIFPYFPYFVNLDKPK